MHRINSLEEKEKAFRKLKIGELSIHISPSDFEVFEYKKGEQVIECYTKMEYMYFIYKGKTKIYIITENGKSLLLEFYHPHHVMGDLEFITGDDSTCYVDAITDCKILAISYEKLKALISEDVGFYKYISAGLAKKLRGSSNSSTINQLYTLKAKISSYILGLAIDIETESFSKIVELEKLKDVADLLGTSYRHLLRTFSELEEEGVILQKGKKITILNLELIKEYSADKYI